MKTPSDALAEFFEKAQWQHDVQDNGRRFCSRYSGKCGHWSFVLILGEDNDRVLLLSILPAIVPATRRSACLDLLNRVNFTLLNGCFEMDPDDGEVRFRTMLALPKEGVPSDLIQTSIGVHLKTVDCHFAALMRVAYTIQTAAEALADPDKSTPRLEWN